MQPGQAALELALRHPGPGFECTPTSWTGFRMHSDILDQFSNEEILKIFVANKPTVLEFGVNVSIKLFIFVNSKAISFEWHAIFNPFFNGSKQLHVSITFLSQSGTKYRVSLKSFKKYCLQCNLVMI